MKKRLDSLMVERGLAATQQQAQALIMAGQVSAEGRRLDKPGMAVDVKIDLHLKEQPLYVSRAGEKLASVARELGLELEGRTVLDVGSSTGGFTDYALQHGAVRVYCVDVGTGQLSYKLRNDPRVVVMEQTDVRDVRLVGPDHAGGRTLPQGRTLPEPVDMAVMDVSFVSLEKVLEPAAALVKPGGLIVVLAKPQFEASKAVADRHRGVIPLGEERDAILEHLRVWVRERFVIAAEADSGVAGAEGNVERFLVLRAK